MNLFRNALGEIDYPTTDGEPMGETDLHRDMMIDLIEALRHYFSEDSQIYVSGNIMLYYEEGNPLAHLSPDVLVTRGIEKVRRETYKLWEIGKAPDLVVEVTSKSTKMRDVGIKKGLYEAMKVKEYILFDPRNEYLLPRFQVYRLESGVFVPCLVPENVGYPSSLNLTFRVVDGILRIFETETDRLLPTPAELNAQLHRQVRKAEAERQKAEAERQKAEAERQKAEAERQKAEAERQKAEAERQKAEAEHHRAEAAHLRAEAEHQRAERLLEKLRQMGVNPEDLN